MQAFLLLSKNRAFITSKIKEFRHAFKISDFDMLDFTKEERIGIEDVREIVRNGMKKPFSGTNKLTVIRNFQNSTPEAQNALLKFLEETPEYLSVILIAENIQNILPTVISRSEIVHDSGGQEKEKFEIASVLNKSVGERMAFVNSSIKTREESLLFLSNLSGFLTDLLLKSDNSGDSPVKMKEIASAIRKVESARVYINSNLNFKHVLDILLLGLPISPAD